MRTRTRLLLVLSLVATALVPVAGPAIAGGDHHPPPANGPDAVLAWNSTATGAAIACGLSDGPPIESRLYAMLHISIHDALNAIKRQSRPYAYTPTTLSPQAAPDAAVAAAARKILSEGLPATCDLTPVENAYSAMIATVSNPDARAAGIALGVASAAAIQKVRASDNSDQPLTRDIDPIEAPGKWQYTPGADGETINGFAFLPDWGSVHPFTLRDSDQFAPRGPDRLDSRQYAKDLNEIKSLGGDGSSPATTNRRTEQQTKIALFWVGSSPYQWNAIARTVSGQSHRMDLWDNARLFGLLNMALADGYIGSFRVKFDEMFWRPVTAIRQANSDGNDRTVADPTWTPLRATPPIPDYDSAHAVEGGAASVVLKSFFGDRTSFSNCSPWYPEYPVGRNNCADGTAGPGLVREFSSFSQAATENGLSRIYVGFHFRTAVDDGLRHGQKIGGWAVTTAMQPTRR